MEWIFRGLRTVGKGWVYGYYFRLVYSGIELTNHFIINDGGLKDEVIFESVGQFTGLKDKNGVDIFDGDIVSDGKTLFEIQMNIQQGKWWMNPIKQIQEHQEDWFILALDNQQLGNGYYLRKDLEIIGSIHENPELLEK